MATARTASREPGATSGAGNPAGSTGKPHIHGSPSPCPIAPASQVTEGRLKYYRPHPRRRRNRSSGPGRNGTGSLAKTEFPTRQFRNSTGSHDTKGLVKKGLFPTVIKHRGETSAALLEARKPSEARTLPALNDLLHEEVLVLENKHRGSRATTARSTPEVGIPGARSDAGYGQLPPVRPASTTVQE